MSSFVPKGVTTTARTETKTSVSISVGGANHRQIAAGDVHARAGLIGIADAGSLTSTTLADAISEMLAEMDRRQRPDDCRNCGARRWVKGACYYCGEERP